MRPCFSFLIILTFSFGVFAQNTDQKDRFISVIGKAIFDTLPDRAKISYSIEGYGKSLRAAVDDVRQKNAVLIKSVMKLGIPEKSISTSYFNSGENYWDKNLFSSKKDFSAVLNVTITVDKFDLLDNLLFDIADAKVKNLGNVEFTFKDFPNLERIALGKSVADAKVKAIDLSDKMGVKLGKILRVENIVNSPQFNEFSNLNKGYFLEERSKSTCFENAESILQSGKMSFSSSVKLVYEIQQQ